MARGGINKALVQQARRALLARGEHPSIDAVRVELGNTGSKTTIHRYLKELEEADIGSIEPEKSLSEQLTIQVAQLAERMLEEAHAAVAQEREALAQERAEYLQRLHQSEVRIKQLEGEAEGLTTQLQEVRLAYQQDHQQLQQALIECARLHQANQDLGVRLADREAQILSLEEKHQHARDALEHYRLASKEQREQEQRRHEAQVQQLQVETRQLQQALIIKQDELTQLNRDNERFVTEARQMRKDLATNQSGLERQAKELASLANRLALSESGKEVLQARANDLQAEVARLVDAVAVQTRQAEALQASLTAMAAQFSQMHHPAPAETANVVNDDGSAEKLESPSLQD